MRIALLQTNPTAGDIGGNSALIVSGARRAKTQGADLVVTPELALMGYLPRDLLMSRGFIHRSALELSRMAADLADCPPLLVGVATPNPSDVGRPLFNYWSFKTTEEDYNQTGLGANLAWMGHVVLHFFTDTRWTRTLHLVR